MRRSSPSLHPVGIRYLGEGCDSVAYVVNGEWVFRFPKREEVVRQLLGELRILPQLVPGSPLPLPSYHFHGKPSAYFPRHFAGYPLLPGIPLPPGGSARFWQTRAFAPDAAYHWAFFDHLLRPVPGTWRGSATALPLRRSSVASSENPGPGD